MFHREGFKIIAITFIIVGAMALTADVYITNHLIKYGVQGVALTILVLILQFFRNPKRAVQFNLNEIIAPVDGKVVVIEEVEEKEYFQGKGKRVSIFMSPLNVHVTRYPASGVIQYSKYHPGKYLVAWHPKASEENERTTIVVENSTFGKVLYRQIAGALAKRIVNYAKIDDIVPQGADSGFIKFGSRVDIFLPLNSEIKVKLNQKVRGGETIIAEIK